MSKEDIIKELLFKINESQETGAIGFSTAKELTGLVRMLQVA